MSGCHNPVLKEWHDERLAEIQYENLVKEHIDGARMRAEDYPEPYRTEFKSQAIALENLFEWARRRFANNK